jgi:hypothetical protein
MTEEHMEVKCPVCGREMEISKVGVLMVLWLLNKELQYLWGQRVLFLLQSL